MAVRSRARTGVRTPEPFVPPARGVPCGLLAGAVAIGVAQLVAGLTGPEGSPLIAVGRAAVDFTPPPVKDFAITTFGSHDKLALLTGIAVLLGGFAALIGVLAARRLRDGLLGIAAFGAIGLLAAVTRPDFVPANVLPTLAGAAAGGGALVLLIRAAAGPPAPVQPVSAVVTATSDDLGARFDRRRFLRLSATAVGVAAVSGVAGRVFAERFSVAQARAALKLPAPAVRATLPPGTDFHIPGLSSFITPNADFYRVDTALLLPEVAPATWQLRIHGMVDREVVLSFADLLRMPLIEDYITLCCVSDPVGGPYISNAKWLGARLAALLRTAGIQPGADELLCTSVDGFTSGTPVQVVMDGRDALLAVAMNGQPLPVEHGFPVRMVVPGLYGYVSATKWLTDINVTRYAEANAYWSQRGWAPQAPIKTESRIDVPSGQRTLSPGPVQVAGVAWAQHKGIDAVEVRVDQGPWQQARLAAVPGVDTWRQWVWDWQATTGQHVIEARATDATGYTQTSVQAPPAPNGASGYPAVQVTVG